MNCEKCKNRKATVFFADESGGRHALCASCGAIQGKLGQITQSDKKDETPPFFLPEPTLFSLTEQMHYNRIPRPHDDTALCPVCKTSAKDIYQSGRMGCSTCYTVFVDILSLNADTQENKVLGRMPKSNRMRRDRKETIARFKLEIRQAIEEENYELAATLRDKIKKLEASTV